MLQSIDCCNLTAPDILRAIDDLSDVILVLLDLSAAFDTLDHQILLLHLKSYFGFTGSVLQWFRSCLTTRSEKVVIGEVASSLRQVESGVPQGSTLGPLLFVLYMAPLQDASLHMAWIVCVMPMIHNYT